jgi:hypothetical protein
VGQAKGVGVRTEARPCPKLYNSSKGRIESLERCRNSVGAVGSKDMIFSETVASSTKKRQVRRQQLSVHIILDMLATFYMWKYNNEFLQPKITRSEEPIEAEFYLPFHI